MKKKTCIVLALIMCIGIVSCTVPEPEMTPFEFSYSVGSPEYYDSKYIYLPQSEFDALSNEQQNALIAVTNTCVSRFWWREKYILGEINETERLDLETAKNILKKYDEKTDISVILQEFAKIQKYPDSCGGSGLVTIQFNIKEQQTFDPLGYPLDYTNSTGIAIFEYGFVKIRYYDENGEVISGESYSFSVGDKSPFN